MTTAQDRLNAILPSWYELLTQWSLDGSLVAAATEALVLDGSNTKKDAKGQLQSLTSQWSAGNFKSLPEIVLLSDADISGAQGAYAASTGTIYLNADWLLTADQGWIQRVLTEELGHSLDDQLNFVDTQGDEGEFFSSLLFDDNQLSKSLESIGFKQDQLTIYANYANISAEASETLVTTSNIIRDVFSGSSSSLYSQYIGDSRYIYDTGRLIYFFAYDGNSNYLWRTDGSSDGTFTITDSIDDIFIFGSSYGKTFFSPTDSELGYELWVTDGTISGTKLVEDIKEGLGSGLFGFYEPDEYLIFEDNLLFSAAAGSSAGLWISDGTEIGTFSLIDNIYSDVYLIGSAAGYAYFNYDDGISGRELWRTDGTVLGTTIVKDVQVGQGSSIDPYILDGEYQFLGDNILFLAFDGLNSALWISDGTETGTRSLTGNNLGIYMYGSTDSQTYFSKTDTATGSELWVTDGTDTGTRLIKDIWSGSSSSLSSSGLLPDEYTLFNNNLLFGASSGPGQYGLWISDGTEEGTKALVQTGYDHYFLGITDSLAFFSLGDDTFGRELWATDGTVEGTRLVKDIWSGQNSGLFNLDEYYSYVVGENVYFAAYTPPTLSGGGFQLWTSDGTAGGTYQVSYGDDYAGILGSVDLGLVYTGYSSQYGYEPWIATFSSTSSTDSGDGSLSAITGDGSFNEGVLLTAGTVSGDPDGSGSIQQYKWFLNDVEISGATASTYQTTANGFGYYTVEVRYLDGENNQSILFSDEIFVDLFDNGDGSLSAITGDGSFNEGVLLTAGTVSGDPDGSGSIQQYKWFLNDVEISGATASTYQTTANGVGYYAVEVRYLDGENNQSIFISDEVVVDTVQDLSQPISIRGNSIYAIVDGYTWQDAETNAVALGGHLASIGDSLENEFLTQFIKPFSSLSLENYSVPEVGYYVYSDLGAWIGLYYENSQWKWISGEDSSFSNFYNEVNFGSGYNYAALYAINSKMIQPSGFWNDHEASLTIGISELTLNLSYSAPKVIVEGSGSFTTTLNFSAGTNKIIDLLEGLRVYWSISGISQDDLEDGGKISGSGFIVDGKLQFASAISLDDVNENDVFTVSVFSDAEMQYQIGQSYSAPIIEIATASSDATPLIISGTPTAPKVETYTVSGRKTKIYNWAPIDLQGNTAQPDVLIVSGGSSNNTITGAGFQDDPSTTANDPRFAYSGVLVIDGKGGSDTITGGIGTNWLIGGGVSSGVDILTGTVGTSSTGAVMDVFDLRVEANGAYSDGYVLGNADIRNFNLTEDFIVLSGASTDYRIASVAKGTRVSRFEIYKGSDLLATVAGSGFTTATNLSNRIVYGQVSESPFDVVLSDGSTLLG